MGVIKYLVDRMQNKAPKGAKRSPKWAKVRKAKLLLQPECEVCGCTHALEVHHVIPFHIAPEKELDIDNLIVLCQNKKYGINCHLLIGHMGNFKTFNILCRIDAVTWRMKLKSVK